MQQSHVKTAMGLVAIAAVMLTISVQGAWAQSVSVGEAIEPLAPGVTVRVVREGPRFVGGGDECSLLKDPQIPLPWECDGSPPFPRAFGTFGAFTIGFDAAGNAYHVSDTEGFLNFGNGTVGHLLRRISPTGVTEDVARVIRQGVGLPDFTPTGAVIDVTS